MVQFRAVPWQCLSEVVQGALGEGATYIAKIGDIVIMMIFISLFFNLVKNQGKLANGGCADA